MRSLAATIGLMALATLRANAAETIAHTVESGDSLWSIAGQADIYADPYLWPVIYKFNRDQIKDPARIYPNQVFQIPIHVDEAARRDARDTSGAPD